MGFLGIGTGEILLILILALIIWGPGNLLEIARTLGKAVRTLKKASFDLTNAVTREIEKTEETPLPKKIVPGSSQNKETSPDTKATKVPSQENHPQSLERHQQ